MRGFLNACMLSFLCASCSTSPYRTEEHAAKLTILHWNDFHAQNVPIKITRKTAIGSDTTYMAGGTATFLGYVNQIRNNRKDVALFNAGDDFQGTPISTFTYGKSQAVLMNMIKPDAITLGNHEFDYGIDSLKSAYASTSFPIVLSNLVNTATGRTFGLPYEIKQFGDVKVGILGATPPDLELLTFRENIEGYRIRDIDSSLNIYIPEMKERHHPDIIVLISHMGLDRDTLLAMRRNDIDVIVGGHTHTPLFSPIKMNRTVIVQAGSKGQYLGKLDLVVDLSGDSVFAYNGELIETVTGAVTPDSAAAVKVAEYESIVDERLGEVIGTLTEKWDRQIGKRVESNIGNFESDVTRYATGTDIGFQNVGGIRKDLDAGPIKVRDIWEINPFGNTLVTFSVRGDVLRTMIEFQAGIQPREFAQVSGVNYVYDSSKPKGSQLVSLTVTGKPVTDSQMYSISTNNYIGSHLKDFFGISDASVKIKETGMVDRDVIIEYIRKNPIITSKVEGRIVDIAKSK